MVAILLRRELGRCSVASFLLKSALRGDVGEGDANSRRVVPQNLLPRDPKK